MAEQQQDYLSPEERELLSRPSFRISGAGGGRPQGPVSRALQSGEAQTQAIRGASMMPYNLLGAGVDLMSLPLSALGYDQSAPVGGSEWFKQQARRAGVAASPPQDPTLRGFFTAGDIGSAVTNPAAGARAVGRAASLLSPRPRSPIEVADEVVGPAGAPRLPAPSSAPSAAGPAPRLEGPTPSLALPAPTPAAPRTAAEDLQRLREAEAPSPAPTTPALAGPPDLLRLSAPTAAPTAAATPPAPPPSAPRQPRGAKPAPRVTAPPPERRGPFYSPLEEFVSTLPGAVTKDQFLGQLKGKFREHEVRRAEEALANLGPKDKIRPDALQSLISQQYSPTQLVTKMLPVDDTKYFRSMDNVYGAPLGVIHLYKPPPAELVQRAEQIDELSRSVNRMQASLRIPSSFPGNAERSLDAIISNPILASDDAIREAVTMTAENIRRQAKSMQALQEEINEAKNMVLYPNLSNYFTREVKALVDQNKYYGNNYVANRKSLEDKTRQEGRQLLLQNGIDLDSFDILSPEGKVAAYNAIDSGAELAIRNSFMYQSAADSVSGLKDTLSQFNRFRPMSYRGQHSSLGTPDGHVAFARYSEHSLNTPDFGTLNGIYVHELQSDLLDDLRKLGPKSKGVEVDREELMSIREKKNLQVLFDNRSQWENDIAMLKEQLADGADPNRINRVINMRQALIDDIDKKLAGQKPLTPEQRAALTKRENLLGNRIFQGEQQRQQGAQIVRAASPYNLEEPFAGAEMNRQAFQQLMAKGVIAEAVAAGKNFVAFPGAESKQAQLYENLPNNLRQVAKDLGPGFEYRSFEVEDSNGVVRMHPVILWDPDGAAADRVKNRGIPFKDGGEVKTPSPDPSPRPSLARRAYEEYQRVIGQPFQQAVRGGIRGYFGLPIMSDADQTGREAYGQGVALSNTPGLGAPAGAFKVAGQALSAAPEAAMFIGALAKTWDRASNAKAVEMEKAGADPRTIWSETGNWRAPDGKWRQEISDAGSSINRSGMSTFQGQSRARRGSALSDVLAHPELEKAYPGMMQETRLDEFAFGQGYPSLKGSYMPGSGDATMSVTAPTKRTAREGAVHESQHAVQAREGFAPGGAPEMAFRDPRIWGRGAAGSDAARKMLRQKREDLQKPMTLAEYAKAAWGTSEITPELRKAYGDYRKTLKNLPPAIEAELQKTVSKEWYRRLAGEAEARATQSRINLTDAERRALYPEESYDVPIDQLIMRDSNAAGPSSIAR